MNRVIMILLAAGLLGTSAAAETTLSITVRQNVLSLRSDVTALRTALAKPGTDPRIALAQYAPRLLDRARAASSSAAQFQKEVGLSAATLQYKSLVAEAKSEIDHLEYLIKQVGDQVQQAAVSARTLEQVAQRIEQLLPRLESMVGGDPVLLTKTCTLPNAVPKVVNGVCAIASCVAGWRNADGNAANGCESPAL